MSVFSSTQTILRIPVWSQFEWDGHFLCIITHRNWVIISKNYLFLCLKKVMNIWAWIASWMVNLKFSTLHQSCEFCWKKAFIRRPWFKTQTNTSSHLSLKIIQLCNVNLNINSTHVYCVLSWWHAYLMRPVVTYESH